MAVFEHPHKWKRTAMPTRRVDELTMDDESEFSNDSASSGDDSEYQEGKVPAAIKKANLELSRSRNRNLPLLSPKKPGRAGQRKPRDVPSKEEVDSFCAHHVDAMKKGHRTQHYVRALMACTISKKATVWETWCTPFFFACIIQELSIFDWIQTGVNAEAVCIDQTLVEATGWKVPRIPHLGDHMKKLFQKAYMQIKAEWDFHYEAMRQDYLMMGRPVVQIPPCPIEDELMRVFVFV